MAHDTIEDSRINPSILLNTEEIYPNEENVDFIITEPVFNFKNFCTSDILHINYGELSFKVEYVDSEFIKCVALNSGVIQKYNSISVEAKDHFLNELIVNDTAKLGKELSVALKLGVEFVVMSVITEPTKEIK